MSPSSMSRSAGKSPGFFAADPSSKEDDRDGPRFLPRRDRRRSDRRRRLARLRGLAGGAGRSNGRALEGDDRATELAGRLSQDLAEATVPGVAAPGLRLRRDAVALFRASVSQRPWPSPTCGDLEAFPERKMAEGTDRRRLRIAPAHPRRPRDRQEDVFLARNTHPPLVETLRGDVVAGELSR